MSRDGTNRAAMGSWPALLLVPALTLCNLTATYALVTPSCSRAGDAAEARPAFLAVVATMTGALSTLVVLAQWLPQWLLSPGAN